MDKIIWQRCERTNGKVDQSLSDAVKKRATSDKDDPVCV
jgi:hypothetical protein